LNYLRATSPPSPLTPASFAAAYGPSVADYTAVTAFAIANHLSVVQSYTARNLLSVSGTVTAIQGALGVTLNQYQRPDGTIFFAPANAPSVNLATSLLGVLGLDNYSLPLPAAGGSASTACFPSPNGPQGAYAGTDFRNAYLSACVSSALEGQGQTIALFEPDSYLPADITAYANGTGLKESPLDVPGLAGNPGSLLSNVTQEVVPLVNPGQPNRVPYNAVTFAPSVGVTSTTPEDVEVDLDISMILAMAPQANLIVYETNSKAPSFSGASFNALLAQMAEDDAAQVISSSWTWPVSTAVEQMAVWSTTIQLASQSQSFLVSSGDFGAFVANDPYTGGAPQGPYANPTPSRMPGEPLIDSPYVTVVGATELLTKSVGGRLLSETTWNDANSPRTINGVFTNSVTGGGFCLGQSPNPANGNGSPPLSVLPIPSWQLNAPGYNYGEFSNPELNNPLGARMIPDVSMVGSAIGIACGVGAGGCGGLVSVCASGSSAATPLWASFLALVNQANGSQPVAPVGFANYLLYQFAAAGEDGPNPFNDVADGSNNDWFDNGQTETSSTAVVPSPTSFIPPTVALPFSAVTSNVPGVAPILTLLPGAAGAGASGTPGLYHAVQGFDLATGLGSPTCNLLELLAPNFLLPGTMLSGITISYHQVGECEGIPTTDGVTEAGSGYAFVVFGIDSVTNSNSTAFTLDPEQLFVPIDAFPSLLSTSGSGCVESSEAPCPGGDYTFPLPSLTSTTVAAGHTFAFSEPAGNGTQYVMMEVALGSDPAPGSAGATESAFSLSYSSTANDPPSQGGTLEAGVTPVKSNSLGGQVQGDCSVITLH
jgi:hypothetical protein